jgi:hypothetical protein
MRVGDKDARSDLVEKCRNGVRVNLNIDRAGVGRHLAEVLIHGLRDA